MGSLQQAVLASWSFPPWVTALDLLSALLYLRGWFILRRVVPSRFSAWRILSFLGGIASLQIALASPLDAFDAFSLTDHMTQHMILMMVVPPLVLLGNPMIPLLRGLPRPLARKVVGPFLNWPPVVRVARTIFHPAFCWVAFSVSLLAWHLPGPYDLALRSDGWHEIEHASFLFTSMLFWWPVIQPWPSRPHWPRWTVPVYLLLAGFPNSVVSAFLIFSRSVLYPAYLAIPRITSMSAQSDQVLAGVVMWFVGSFAFLIPAVVLMVKLLSPQRYRRSPARRATAFLESRFLRVAFPAFTLLLPLAALAYGYLAPRTIDVDGDVVRIEKTTGPFRISVFTAPDPLAAGPCDLSVLVEDRQSGQLVLDAPVSLAIAPPDASDPSSAVRATHAASSVKLLEAGTVDIPRQGVWNLRVWVGTGRSATMLQSTLKVTSRD